MCPGQLNPAAVTKTVGWVQGGPKNHVISGVAGAPINGRKYMGFTGVISPYSIVFLVKLHL